MAGEVARRTPTSAEIEQITRDYDPVRVAGIWEFRPTKQPRQAFPFLALSQSRMHVPLKSLPRYRYDAGITSAKSIFPFPRIETIDTYSDFAETGLVQIVGLRKRKAQVWVPRRLSPLRMHPPILEALGTFLQETGVEWDPSTLTETDINSNFQTLKAAVPNQMVTMELGGPARSIEASALIAAGLRIAVSETLAIQDFRDYAATHPDQFTPIIEA